MVQSILIYSMGEVIGDGLIKLPFIAGLRAAFPRPGSPGARPRARRSMPGR
jgi:ADP-heptose:LPS heptosyltransferase